MTFGQESVLWLDSSKTATRGCLRMQLKIVDETAVLLLLRCPQASTESTERALNHVEEKARESKHMVAARTRDAALFKLAKTETVPSSCK